MCGNSVSGFVRFEVVVLGFEFAGVGFGTSGAQPSLRIQDGSDVFCALGHLSRLLQKTH